MPVTVVKKTRAKISGAFALVGAAAALYCVQPNDPKKYVQLCVDHTWIDARDSVLAFAKDKDDGVISVEFSKEKLRTCTEKLAGNSNRMDKTFAVLFGLIALYGAASVGRSLRFGRRDPNPVLRA